MNPLKVYIMEMVGGYFRGMIAEDEETAREMAALKGHVIKEIVRVEPHIEVLTRGIN